MANLDDNPQEPWAVRDLVEQTVADWLKSWASLPLPNVIEDVYLGELSGWIERRLIAAGLVDTDRCDDPCGFVA